MEDWPPSDGIDSVFKSSQGSGGGIDLTLSECCKTLFITRVNNNDYLSVFDVYMCCCFL